MGGRKVPGSWPPGGAAGSGWIGGEWPRRRAAAGGKGFIGRYFINVTFKLNLTVKPLLCHLRY